MNHSLNLKAIVAMSSNKVIGENGDLPWSIPEDLKIFKKYTINNTIIMGRKTMESLKKPLPNRKNIVLSRTITNFPLCKDNPNNKGFIFVNNKKELWKHIQKDKTSFIIGGEQVYKLFLPYCNEILLTYIYKKYSGSTVFPEFESNYKLKEIIQKNHLFELRRYEKIM